MAEWISHVDPAARDRISLLPKVSVHCCLPSAACMRAVWKVGLAVHILIQCTPLLVEKAGVALDVTLRFTACKQVSVQVRQPTK